MRYCSAARPLPSATHLRSTRAIVRAGLRSRSKRSTSRPAASAHDAGSAQLSGKASVEDEPQPEDGDPPQVESGGGGTVLMLLVLGLAYVHHSVTGFGLPALLPEISPDLEIDDAQGALLTTGYTVLYAVALVPAGLIADRVNRPVLLAAGIITWSLLTSAAGSANSFQELLALRVAFAAAEAIQNPVCFSLIPELYPARRTTALAFYNCAIYIGRAMSYVGVVVMALATDAVTTVGMRLIPLDALDATSMSLLYTSGDKAAVTSVYDPSFTLVYEQLRDVPWRNVLQAIGIPGLVISMLVLLIVAEPRRAPSKALAESPPEPIESPASSPPVAPPADIPNPPSRWTKFGALLGNRVFLAATLAATLNDVASWSLVAWQGTFYERVYELDAQMYAPMLALIIPVGGIVGGVGGGLLSDWLSARGGRPLLTVVATLLASPLLYVSVSTEAYQESFAALLIGFALSEAWRAPTALLVREVAPEGSQAVAVSIHLCLRNLIGGLGPLAIAWGSQQEDYGLQTSMLLVPICFALSGVGFVFTEWMFVADKQRTRMALPNPPRS